jgi:glutaredoxin
VGGVEHEERRDHAGSGDATVIVYGKADCSLCDKATAVLARLRSEFGFRIEHVDVTADPELYARYRDRIPVVVLNGREIAAGVVTTPAVRSALGRPSRP